MVLVCAGLPSLAGPSVIYDLHRLPQWQLLVLTQTLSGIVHPCNIRHQPSPYMCIPGVMDTGVGTETNQVDDVPRQSRCTRTMLCWERPSHAVKKPVRCGGVMCSSARTTLEI